MRADSPIVVLRLVSDGLVQSTLALYGRAVVLHGMRPVMVPLAWVMPEVEA